MHTAHLAVVWHRIVSAHLKVGTAPTRHAQKFTKRTYETGSRWSVPLLPATRCVAYNLNRQTQKAFEWGSFCTLNMEFVTARIYVLTTTPFLMTADPESVAHVSHVAN